MLNNHKKSDYFHTQIFLIGWQIQIKESKNGESLFLPSCLEVLPLCLVLEGKFSGNDDGTDDDGNDDEHKEGGVG